MPQRRLLLRIMLWSLAIGAVLGALAILTGGGTAIWRVSATTFTAAIAAALMMVTSRISEHKSGRTAGLVGMLLIIAEFLLTLILIWEVPVVGGSQSEESLGLTALNLFLCGAPLVLFLRLYPARNTRIMAITGIIFAVAAFVVAMIGCWVVIGWSEKAKWFASTAAIGGAGVFLTACLIGVGGGGSLPVLLVRLGGAIATLFTLGVAWVGIWGDFPEDTGLFRISLSLAAVIAHANLCFAVPLKPGQRWVRWATVAAAACTAFFINVSLSRNASDIEFTGRLAGASGVIAACGSLGLVVLARMNRKMTDETPVLTEIRELTIICPGCQKKQSLPVGQTSCPTCRLRFHIRVEEPHCPQCDYLVFMLSSDRCPECGTVLKSGITATANQN